MKSLWWIGLMVIAGVAWGQPQGPDILWSRTYDYPPAFRVSCLRVMDSEDLIISGDVWNQTSNDLFVMRLNSEGDTLWLRIYGDPGANEYDGWLAFAPDGGLVLAGSDEGTDNAPLQLYRLDLSGNSRF
jgi:hypothetical protein